MSEKTILIVDDDPDLVFGLSTRLKFNKFRVISASDASSAISVALTEAPDMMILDLGLPAGGGFQVLEQMKSLDKLAAIPVIVLSARDPAHNKRRALDAGAAAFIQKPPDNRILLATIRQTLGESVGMATLVTT